MRDLAKPKHAKPQTDRPGSGTPVRRVEVQTLFGGAHEVIILHRGEDYRLRITRNGKLILTK